MFSNAIYGIVGISMELIGESWFTATAYYERMFQGNAPKSKISTFVKAGIGGAAAWEESYGYILGQFGILTGIKKGCGCGFNGAFYNIFLIFILKRFV